MQIMKKYAAPRYRRDGVVSYLLVSLQTGGVGNLAVTLVEMEPGGIQKPHAHDPEQMYYILEGSGMMTVGSEREPVGPGDCIAFPSRTVHGLENTGGTVLRYLSAASPSFTERQCRKLWPLPSLQEEAEPPQTRQEER
jgi:mannose-6-phosphate isomerase-like protein (cupin superfamily)